MKKKQLSRSHGVPPSEYSSQHVLYYPLKEKKVEHA